MPVVPEDLPAEYRAKFEELCREIDFKRKSTKGTNGEVLFGTNKLLGRDVVVKFYYYGDGAHVEPATLARLESEHVLKVDNAGAIDKTSAYFVTRFCEMGDLDDHMDRQRPPVREAVNIIRQVCYGASYLHANGFLHRDLKPSNLFQETEGKFVIGDFGSVVGIRTEGYAEAITKHSVIYRPPEDFDGDRFYKQGDIYQLGLCLYQILGGKLPYDLNAWLSKKEQEKVQALGYADGSVYANQIIESKIKSGKVIDLKSLPACIPQCLRKIIRKATHQDMDSRYNTVADLIAALNNIDKLVVDWRLVDGIWTAIGGRRSYRFFEVGNTIVVEKKLTGSAWRREKTWLPKNEDAAVAMIEAALG